MMPPINPALKGQFKRSSSIKGDFGSQPQTNEMGGPRSSSHNGRMMGNQPAAAPTKPPIIQNNISSAPSGKGNHFLRDPPSNKNGNASHNGRTPSNDNISDVIQNAQKMVENLNKNK